MQGDSIFKKISALPALDKSLTMLDNPSQSTVKLWAITFLSVVTVLGLLGADGEGHQSGSSSSSQSSTDSRSSNGMSKSERLRCEENTLTYRTVLQVAAQMAQFKGAEAAMDEAIANLKSQGLSDACISHLSNQG